MQEHIETFLHCCAALLTGINVVEANAWLTALVENKSICLPLCVAVIAAADAATTHAVFLAAKLIHNVLRETHYSNPIDVEYVQVSNLVI